MINKKIFFNAFLVIFIVWIGKLISYSKQFKDISTEYYLFSIIFFTILVIISLFFVFKSFSKIKFIVSVNLFIASILLIITSLSYDFYRDHLNNLDRSNQLQKRIKIAKQLGKKFDERTKIEFLNELRKKNRNSNLSYNPSIILKEFSKNKKIADLLPLSGLSKTLIVDCNESGTFSTFKSDRYGFNNLDSIYEKKGKKVILIGDSFVQGQCVNQKNTIAYKLNEKGYNTISLGLAGNGPLLELAILKEYGLKLNPSKIIWFFFENDIRDLEKNSKSEILKMYMHSDYTQENIKRQKEIDVFWKKYEKKKIKEKKVKKKNILKKIERAIFLKSYKDFVFDSFEKEYIEYKNINTKNIEEFIKIINLSKKISEETDAKFYFVYLPFYKSILYKEPESKKEILNKIKKLNINYFDFQEELKKFKDPLNFFPLKIEGHYTDKGYELIAEKIVEKFLD